MTRIELLRLVIGRARSNGFEFRRWYTTRLNEPWINADTALQCLDAHRRYYSLLFSHDFARSFWKPGSEITFRVEAQTFLRRMPDGTIGTVHRKPFTRRSSRPTAWRFHLREMAAAEEPLRYIRRYLHVLEDEMNIPQPLSTEAAVARPAAPAVPPRVAGPILAKQSQLVSRRPPPVPLHQDLTAFLRRPTFGQAPGSGPAA